MAWHPAPQRIRLDGRELVLLSPDDFDRLDTIRRQSGALTARVSALRQQLAEATAALSEIDQAVALTGCSIEQPGGRPACLRDRILAILAPDTDQSGQAVSAPA
jgi:hypothetical protein